MPYALFNAQGGIDGLFANPQPNATVWVSDRPSPDHIWIGGIGGGWQRDPSADIRDAALATENSLQSTILTKFNTGQPLSPVDLRKTLAILFRKVYELPETTINSILKDVSDPVKLDANLVDYNSTALTNATGLSFPITAGTMYNFKFNILYQTAALTTGIGLGLNFPAVFSQGSKVSITGLAADGTDSEFTGVLTASDDFVLSTAVGIINTTFLAVIQGNIVPSANGILQVRYKSEVNGNAVRIMRGSCGFLNPVF